MTCTLIKYSGDPAALPLGFVIWSEKDQYLYTGSIPEAEEALVERNIKNYTIQKEITV